MINAAELFGMLPQDYLKVVRHRWHRVVTRLLEERWNQPDRTDHYLMRLMKEVWAVKMKPEHRSKLKIDDFRVKFSREPAQTTPDEVHWPEGIPRLSKEEVEEIYRKGTWTAATSDPKTPTTVLKLTKDEMEQINALPLAEAAAERRRLARERGKKIGS